MSQNREVVILHRAEAPFVPSCLRSTGDAEPLEVRIRRKLLFHLNKTTLQKFDRATTRMLELLDSVNTVDLLELVVGMVIEKAVAEPKYAEMYARACQCLSVFTLESPVEMNGPNTSESITQHVTFLLVLISKTQREFEAVMRQTNDAKEVTDRDRRRAKGIALFVAELYNVDLFVESIALQYLQCFTQVGLELGNELSLECLYIFLSAAGRKLDSTQHVLINDLFGRIGALIDQRRCSTRLRCLLTNLVELRDAAWQPRAVTIQDRPRTLDDIRREAYGELEAARDYDIPSPLVQEP